MTGQVIDTLTVNVEVDAKKFKPEIKQVRHEIDETKKSALSFFASLGGAYALKDMVQTVTETSAAIGLLANNLQVSTQALQSWGNMASMFGGSAGALQGTISGLVSEFEKFKLTGESALTPMMNKFADLDRQDPFKFLEGLKGKLDALNDPRQSKFILDFFHVDQGTQNLLLNTSADKLHKLLIEQQKKNLVDKEGAKQAQELRESYTGLLQTLDGMYRQFVGEISPGMEEGFKKITVAAEYLVSHKEAIVGFFTALAVAVTAALLPTIALPLLILGIAAAIGLLYDDFTTWKKGGNHLLPWEDWSKDLDDVIKKVKELYELFQVSPGKAIGKVLTGIGNATIGAGKAVVNALGFGASPIAKALMGAEGGYSSVNLGKKGGYKASTVDLSSKTIDEVLADQAAGKYNAAGHYQMIPGTLKMAKEGGGYSGKELFNEHTQDALGAWILMNKRRALGDYISGKSNDLHGAAKDYANEWRAVADPDTGLSVGGANNRASISAIEAANQIRQQREWYAANNGAAGGSSSSSETHIGTINIQTQATDAQGIGRSIHKALTDQADGGMR